MPTKRICLSCGTDRQELASMLNELEVLVWNPNTGDFMHLRSENHQFALNKINKCAECREVFERERLESNGR